MSLPQPFARALSFFALRPAPGRLSFALRASLCMGVPVAAGVLGGRVDEGLMAMLGAFTALYGGGRPYAYRAIMLALIATGFALAVGIGVAASRSHVTAIVAVSAIAMAATYLCLVLETGPPGAYLFVLACAVGTAMPAGMHPLAVAGLVFAGGAFSWAAHMAGALFNPHGPEKLAVLRAAKATGAFVRTVGTPAQDRARHAAATSLHEAWSALVTWQPWLARDTETVGRLRAVNRDLHHVFAEAAGRSSRGETMPAESVEEVREVARRVRDLRNEPQPPHGPYPLGRLRAAEALRESLRAGSSVVVVVARVGIAAVVAGSVATTMGLEHVYWSIAAAVLVLHYGHDRRRTLERAVQRLVGTWIGLVLAAPILYWHPQGLWLAAAVMVLQFVIEMLVVRNYAVGVVFITAIALLMATAAHPSVDVSQELLARGIDTALGCAVAIVVFTMVRPHASVRLRDQLARTVSALDAVLRRLRDGSATTPAGYVDRRALQHRLFLLGEAFDAGAAGTLDERREADVIWPDVASLQRLAYDTLSLCWRMERGEAVAGELDRLDGERRQLQGGAG